MVALSAARCKVLGSVWSNFFIANDGLLLGCFSSRMEKPKTVNISKDEIEQLKARLRSRSLSENDLELLCEILQFFVWLRVAYESKKGVVSRLLRKIFGSKTEKKKKPKNPKPNDNDSTPSSPPSVSPGEASSSAALETGLPVGNAQEGSQNTNQEPAQSTAESENPLPGHGRSGAKDYPGAEEIYCPHILQSGSVCLSCKKGKIYKTKPGIFLNIVGQPLLKVTKYILERMRCNLCGSVFTAPLPAGLQKWDPSAKATTAVYKYGYGFPQYRQERVLADHGTRVADSTLYEKGEEVADAGRPVAQYLEKLAAQSQRVMNADDTKLKIIELMKENEESNPERTGIYTSAIIAEHEDHKIFVFKSGRNNAGENLDELFTQRDPSLPPPRIMVDGSSSNFPKTLQAIIHNCLTHGRREFCDLEVSFPKEASVIIELLAEVYKNDDLTKGFSDEDRLKYHQDHSAAVMDKIFTKLNEYKQTAEPNGGLMKAVRYMLKRWPELNRFLTVPGAPLDNNTAERAIKLFVLYRKNSYFYLTQVSAWVGDILMTLIHTAVDARASPIHYLTQIQIHKKQVFKNPEQWLPWNYLENPVLQPSK
jgi:transposase